MLDPPDWPAERTPVVSLGPLRPEGLGWRQVPGRVEMFGGEQYVSAPYWIRDAYDDERKVLTQCLTANK